MEKLQVSKSVLKMAGERMHIPHPTPLYPPLAISYRNHQKSLASLCTISFVLFYHNAESIRSYLCYLPVPSFDFCQFAVICDRCVCIGDKRKIG